MRIDLLGRHHIRADEVNGKSYWVLKDICEAMNLMQKDLIHELGDKLVTTSIKIDSDQGDVYMTAVDHDSVCAIIDI